MLHKLLLNINIVTEYSIWLLLVCFIVGFLYAFLFYRKENRFDEIATWLKRVMFAFRFLVVSILCFLLLTPLIKTIFNKVEKPLIVLVQDNSASILMNKDSVFYKTTYLEKLEQLKQEIEKNYEIKTYTFSGNINDNKVVEYTGKITNLSNVFADIESRFYNQNLGAVILASDGIFNEGSNPVFTSKSNGVPVYTIALGDTSAQKDIILKGAIANKLTFLGNKFPIEINGLAQQAEQAETKLEIIHQNNVVYTKSYTIDNNKYVINENILLEAKDVGVQHYKIKLSSIKNEVSYTNNTKDVYIDVLDGRQEILILADAPHPDLKALKLSIEQNENYKVTAQFLDNFNGKIDPYSLVILYQIPNNNPIVEKINQSKTSIWYILNAQSDIKFFNKLKTGLNIQNYRGQSNDVLANVNEQFPLFTLSEKTIKFINNTPPLLSVFGTFQSKEIGYPLLHQKIRNITTESPLMTFFQKENKKIAILAGEGIWRWRMLEFKQTNKQEAVNELINKTVQFLSVKEDKSKFRLIVGNSFLENEEVIFNAELYNDSYELINDPEIKLEITDDKGGIFNYDFNKTTSAYFLSAGIYNPGSYQYKAVVKFGDKMFTEKGEFQVSPILLESNNTIANHKLLNNLALKHGGELFYPSNMHNVAKVIEENNNITSIIYEEKDLKEMINFKWIFILVISLLSIEWFLRKRNGAY